MTSYVQLVSADGNNGDGAIDINDKKCTISSKKYTISDEKDEEGKTVKTMIAVINSNNIDPSEVRVSAATAGLARMELKDSAVSAPTFRPADLNETFVRRIKKLLAGSGGRSRSRSA